ncbi:hypothetical protein D9M71_718520 [compost metagenome]
MFMRLAKEFGHLPGDGTRHGALTQLQHMDVGPQGGSHCRELQADETGANHHHITRFFGERRQGISIGFGFDAEHLCQLRTGNR